MSAKKITPGLDEASAWKSRKTPLTVDDTDLEFQGLNQLSGYMWALWHQNRHIGNVCETFISVHDKASAWTTHWQLMKWTLISRQMVICWLFSGVWPKESPEF